MQVHQAIKANVECPNQTHHLIFIITISTQTLSSVHFHCCPAIVWCLKQQMTERMTHKKRTQGEQRAFYQPHSHTHMTSLRCLIYFRSFLMELGFLVYPLEPALLSPRMTFVYWCMILINLLPSVNGGRLRPVHKMCVLHRAVATTKGTVFSVYTSFITFQKPFRLISVFSDPVFFFY